MPDIADNKNFIEIVTENLKHTQIQIISEGYELLKKIYKLNPDEISKVFEKINKNRLHSELLEKASKLCLLTWEDKKFIIDSTNDVISDNKFEFELIIKSLEKNTLNTLMLWAYQAKNFSKQKEKRTKLHNEYFFNQPYNNVNLKHFLILLESSLDFAFFISFIQYITYIKQSSEVDIMQLVEIWSQKTELNSGVLTKLISALDPENIDELLINPWVKQELNSTLQDFKILKKLAINFNIPTPCFNASLNYFYELIDDSSWASLVELFKSN